MRYGGLIVAIVFAAIAAIVVLRMSGGQSSEAPVAAATQSIKGVPVYVAAAEIPIGTTITQEMVTTQQWPENLMLAGFIKADNEGPSKVIGMVSRAPFQTAEPIIDSKLANPSDPNFLAGDLPKGMRVVTIPVNDIEGVAGFVFPGDHVDLIYTHEVEPPSSPDQASAPQRQTVTETLLTNVKVLAVDQRSSNAGATDTKGNLVVPKSASVMVSQSDAQRVRLAQKTGTVTMVLRALADKESSDPMIVTQQRDISQKVDVGAVDASGIKVVRGVPTEKKENVTSGSPVVPQAFGSPSSGGATSTPQVTP